MPLVSDAEVVTAVPSPIRQCTMAEALIHPNYKFSVMAYIQAIPRRYDEHGILLFQAWQLSDYLFLNEQVTCCEVRARGGSKTCDGVDWLVHRVLRTKEAWAWLSVKGGQLDQAKKYFLSNPFVSSVNTLAINKYEVILCNGCTIRLGIISTTNLGMRLDGICFDEFEDCHEKDELVAFSQMGGMMTVSPIHKTIYYGTLWNDRLFARYATLYPTRTRGWRTIPHLVRAGYIQSVIDAHVVPQYEIDLLYECIPASPKEAVFAPLVVRLPKAEFLQRCPKSGHKNGFDFGSLDTRVTSITTDAEIWVTEEKRGDLERYPDCFDDSHYPSEGETGGYNDNVRYAAKSGIVASRYNAALSDASQAWKKECQIICRQRIIYVCDEITPNVVDDLLKAIYEPDGSGVYYKNEQKGYGMHYLDAFLHSVHCKIGVLIMPNQTNKIIARRRTVYDD